MTLTLFAIACGVLALLYGIFTSGQVLRAPAGNQRMGPERVVRHDLDVCRLSQSRDLLRAGDAADHAHVRPHIADGGAGERP